MKCRIFTTPTCIKCRKMKEYLADLAEVEMVDASTPEGLDQARELGVTSVPTVFVFDKLGNELGVGRDIDEVEALLNN